MGRPARPFKARPALAWLLPLVVVVLLILAVAVFVLPRLVSPPASAPRAPAADTPVAAGGDWEVAFTTPVYPADPTRYSGGLDARLVALMDRTTRTLDVAVYDFDLASVADAMARAAGRGVRVRMVTDTDTLENTRDERVQAAFTRVRAAGIPIVPDGRRSIMHDKFTVADGEWVQTGSWNYTEGDTYRLNNNLAILRSEPLAARYTAEFETMFTQRKFGAAKPPGVPRPVLEIGTLRVESLFAPRDGVARRIVEQVAQAQRKVHFLAFSFTHDGIGQAMIARRQAGVEVQGVFETTGSSTSFSEYGRMAQAGLDVYQDGNPYVMHHKVILLDDRVTIFGSFNFSDNADKDNDENVLIVEDPAFAAAFEQEFQRVLALARSPRASRTRDPGRQPTSSRP